MLTETKNIRKKSPNFISEIQKSSMVWPKSSNNQNLKEIHTLGTEIIATRTEDGRQATDKFRFHELS